MEGRGNEAEYDELEELLCEIPNVTAPNPSFGGSVMKRAFDDQTFDLVSAFSDMSLIKKQTFSDVNAPMMVIPSFQTPTNGPYGFYSAGQEAAPTVSRFTNSHSVRCQVPNYSYLSNIAVMSDHQQMLQQHRIQHQIGWRNMNMDVDMDKERLYQMQLQMESGNTRFLSLNAARQHEHFKQEPVWNAYVMPKAPNQSETLAWDRMGRQNYPDKVFGRSHGMNVVSNARSWDPTFETSADLKASPLIRYNSLNEVSGRIYLMAKDQYGCRFLQRKFSDGTQEELDMIFSEIADHIVDLMTDPFGNYLVQKLLEVCNEYQLMRILHLITRSRGELVRVSCDMHGTRAVQKIIETLKTEEQFVMVVSSLKQNAVALMKNMNGNHVAQKCLQHLMPEYCDFLFEAASRNCVELATDRHGCCVLQKCLGHADGDQRNRLICEIAANALFLSQDPFGNYVVQYLFDLKLMWAVDKVLDKLEGSFGELAVQKHSSNVVERCLKCATEERRNRIVDELIHNPRLDQIMQDPFGNYVTQAALDKSKGSVYAKLVDAIKPYVSMLRTSPYGKKVLTRLTSNK